MAIAAKMTASFPDAPISKLPYLKKRASRGGDVMGSHVIFRIRRSRELIFA